MGLTSAYADDEPSRTIHLVYDDSGSMIHDEQGVYLDTWCQARYSMEVVAAMLEPKDDLSIYYMSSYDAAPFVLYGQDGAQTNVEKIHTRSMEFSQTTPFKAVQTAFTAFKRGDEREKWLVVLSDGAFTDTPQDVVERRFHEYAEAPSTNVAILAMGNDGPTIHVKPDSGVYYARADSRHILDELTQISNQIFKRHALDVSAEHKIQFSVPMRELIVLAQGRDVKINGMTAPDGKRYEAVSNVHASSDYASAANKIKHPELVVPCTLNGYVAKFEGDFVPGEYQLDVTGADSVVVYFKPNVTVAAYLYHYGRDQETPIPKDEKIVNGRYYVQYGLVSATPDRTPVKDISILERDGSKVTYDATILNRTPDNVEHPLEAQPGKAIDIQEGTLTIQVQANFLKYTHVSAEMTYDVHYENEFLWQVSQNPKYGLTVNGFENEESPIILEVTMKTKDGKSQPLTAEEWQQMPVSPRVTQVFPEDMKPEEQTHISEFKIMKVEDEIGKYKLWPKLAPEEANQFKTRGLSSLQYEVSAYFQNANTGSTAHGYYTGTMDVEDKIGFIDRVKEWIHENPIKTGLLIALFLIFLGYGPQKKRLPKTLIVKMTAERTKLGKSKRLPEKKEPEYGRYRREGVGIPWPICRAHTATISFNDEFPSLRVHASKEKYTMTVENPEVLASVCPKLKKNPNINWMRWKFDGENEKGYYKYTCQLTTRKS